MVKDGEEEEYELKPEFWSDDDETNITPGVTFNIEPEPDAPDNLSLGK